MGLGQVQPMPQAMPVLPAGGMLMAAKAVKKQRGRPVGSGKKAR